MSRIQQAIQLAASPPAVDVEVDVQWLADAAQGPDGEPDRALALEL